MVDGNRAAVLSLLVVACGGPSPPPAGLYLLGALDIGCQLDSDPGPSIDTYWVNGEAEVLTDCDNWNVDATGIAVTDEAVLVAGEADNRAAYWDDGAVEFLSELESAASSIVVSGGDAYISGHERQQGSPTRAVYWKNGEPQVLSHGGNRAVAIDIAVSAGDIYVLGPDDEARTDEDGFTSYLPREGYWVNGTRVDLFEQVEGDDRAVSLTSIAVQGDDVFVVGEQTLFADSTPTLWTNGVPSAIEEAVEARAVAADGTDVYVAGMTSSGAALWRNGTLVPLAGTDGVCSSASDVTITDGDVHVVGGRCDPDEDGRYVPAVWKNGELVSDGVPQEGSTHALFVRSPSGDEP